MLKASQVREQLNLDQTIKLHIRYHDLRDLCTSFDYFKGFKNNISAMTRQLGPQTYFVIPISTKKLMATFNQSIAFITFQIIKFTKKFGSTSIISCNTINLNGSHNICKVL